MKYIRTNTGVYEVTDDLIINRFGHLAKKADPIITISGVGEIIKQSDTIEELCDEFVIADVEHKCRERVFKPALVQVIKNNKKPYEIYGAIWTDKGLIFVARMNNEGVLELL